jgi:hypothetical protein
LQVFDSLLEVFPLGGRQRLQTLLDGVEQVLLDEALDPVAALIQDPVDAEVQFRGVELEQVAEERLELLAVLNTVARHHGHRSQLPSLKWERTQIRGEGSLCSAVRSWTPLTFALVNHFVTSNPSEIRPWKLTHTSGRNPSVALIPRRSIYAQRVP